MLSLPRIYGQPKVHKAGYPLREIVDAIGGVTRDINKYIGRIIKTYTLENEYTIKNSNHFVSMIKDLKVEEDETLVSYDVKALYPSVPQEEALQLVKELLMNDNKLHEKTPMKAKSVMKLLTICVENTYFMFNKKLYIQVNGLAIGASTSGFLADIFMYKLEKRAIATFICPPSIWKRYVDDTFAKLKKIHVLQFMEHLNSQHERIEFTSEELIERKLAMLDTELNVKEDGHLKIKIYRKPTHTDQYLMFDSNHHISQKLGIISTMKHRINTLITEDDDKKVEEERMKASMRECGYPERALNRDKKQQYTTGRTKRKSSDSVCEKSV